MDNYVEHVVKHYLARDKWRIAMREYLERQSNQAAYMRLESRVPSPAHFINNGDQYLPNPASVHNTRQSLKRSKNSTVEYLHELLHKEEVLSDDKHFHQGGDIFHFLIHEVEDVPDLGDLL